MRLKGKMYRVLRFDLYYLVDNYICINYLYCQSKTLSRIYSNRILEQTSFNILPSIGSPEVLLNLLSCHGFMEKLDSTVILNCRYHLVNKYLEKGFFIIEKNSNQLSILLNDLKLRINAIEKLEIYFVIAKNTAIYSVANTIREPNINLYHR